MADNSADIPAGEQIKSRTIFSRRTSSSVYCLGTYIIVMLLLARCQRQKKKSFLSLSQHRALLNIFPFSLLDILLPLFISPPLSLPSYFIRAHHRSLTAGYRCFHHSPKGPRLPLPRSYLAPSPLFSAYPSLVHVSSPRLIISALIGSEEFHIG